MNNPIESIEDQVYYYMGCKKDGTSNLFVQIASYSLLYIFILIFAIVAYIEDEPNLIWLSVLVTFIALLFTFMFLTVWRRRRVIFVQYGIALERYLKKEIFPEKYRGKFRAIESKYEYEIMLKVDEIKDLVKEFQSQNK